MNVLHVYSGNLYGGIESMLLNLARHRGAAADLQQQFALAFDGPLSARLRQAGAGVHLLGRVRWRYPWTVWQARRRLSKLLASQTWDAVLIHSPWNWAVFAPAVPRDLPKYLWMHERFSGQPWIERWAMRTQPTHLIANSRFAAAPLATHFPHVPHTVIPPAIELPAFADTAAVRQDVRLDQDVPPKRQVILQVSRWLPLKGQAVLAEALAHLPRDLAWECWFVGAPQQPHEVAYQQQVLARLETLGLTDRVRLLGHRDDVPRLMAAADVFCQPNTEPEGFGMVFVEALAAGLPVVTSACGGALEIVDPTCGQLVLPGDSMAVAAALTELLSDAGLRAQLGAAGRQRAQQLCGPGRVLALLRDLIHSHCSSVIEEPNPV